MKNVIWFSNIGSIGGVETVVWNVIRKYKDYDITIWYKNADIKQLKRYSKYVNLLKFDESQNIECERLIINYDYETIKGHFKADKVIYLIHANYKYLIENKIDRVVPITEPSFEYYAVSKYASDMYYEVSDIKPKVCYNPVIVDDDREALVIVSATRLFRDKGSLVERMELLADKLDEHNVPFVWLVFTNSDCEIKNKSVVNLPSRLDILPFLRKADFVAQLSDSEGFCMTALESASLGTPLLITDIPSFKEMKLNDENAIYFNLDMSNVDECVEKMKNKYSFKYTPNKDVWDELLIKGKRKEPITPLKLFKVKATKESENRGIEINEVNGIAKENTIFEVTEDRLKVLLGNNVYGIRFVELV